MRARYGSFSSNCIAFVWCVGGVMRVSHPGHSPPLPIHATYLLQGRLALLGPVQGPVLLQLRHDPFLRLQALLELGLCHFFQSAVAGLVLHQRLVAPLHGVVLDPVKGPLGVEVLLLAGRGGCPCMVVGGVWACGEAGRRLRRGGNVPCEG